MDLFQRRNRRPPLVTCLIVAFVFVAVGTTGLITAVVVFFVVSDSAGTSEGGIGDDDTTPGVSTTAPATGGWSSAD